MCAHVPSFETYFSFSERRRYAIEWKNLRQKNLWTHLATLDIRHGFNRRKIRWSLAAQDICFTNVWHSYFFMLGKCIPIVRGNGVYQEAMDFCIERLACGEWVHVFPEGKVNMFKEDIRFVFRITFVLSLSDIQSETLLRINSIVLWHGKKKHKNVYNLQFRFLKRLSHARDKDRFHWNKSNVQWLDY